ncbi:DUF3291 domain-containing protein [Aquisalimonas asiatica]|uniref:DUF3291 domain-containing protein n=1 Tax=Aquisalimonas asiatica TaxID=406100 RepID=A0A1H8TEL6_9GAMM|nr:DUF3291 domain-containing protein [Aquisalimonas asiatica]SEO89367.1 protein of unknown function [Aquisalimonas asiatica]
MSGYELAQLNVAVLKDSLESPLLADFVANLDPINALAEDTPGFLWRLETEEGDATALRPLGDDMIVNMSVWEDIESLHGYVYRSAHAAIMARRKEWFHRMAEAYSVLWWVPAGYRPSIDEALERLDALRRHGPHAQAFTFRKPFPAPGAGAMDGASAFPDACQAE